MRVAIIVRAALLAVIAAAVLDAQEFGAFAASGRLYEHGARNYYGGGLSVAAIATASRVPAGVGLRASLVLVTFEGYDRNLACEPPLGCPPQQLQIIVPQVMIVAQPYRSNMTRFDLTTGLAGHALNKDPIPEIGVSVGAGVSRRPLRKFPVWVSAQYERHISVHERPFDESKPEMLQSVFHLGLRIDR